MICTSPFVNNKSNLICSLCQINAASLYLFCIRHAIIRRGINSRFPHIYGLFSVYRHPIIGVPLIIQACRLYPKIIKPCLIGGDQICDIAALRLGIRPVQNVKIGSSAGFGIHGSERFFSICRIKRLSLSPDRLCMRKCAAQDHPKRCKEYYFTDRFHVTEHPLLQKSVLRFLSFPKEAALQRLRKCM